MSPLAPHASSSPSPLLREELATGSGGGLAARTLRHCVSVNASAPARLTSSQSSFACFVRRTTLRPKLDQGGLESMNMSTLSRLRSRAASARRGKCGKARPSASEVRSDVRRCRERSGCCHAHSNCHVVAPQRQGARQRAKERDDTHLESLQLGREAIAKQLHFPRAPELGRERALHTPTRTHVGIELLSEGEQRRRDETDANDEAVMLLDAPQRVGCRADVSHASTRGAKQVARVERRDRMLRHRRHGRHPPPRPALARSGLRDGGCCVGHRASTRSQLTRHGVSSLKANTSDCMLLSFHLHLHQNEKGVLYKRGGSHFATLSLVLILHDRIRFDASDLCRAFEDLRPRLRRGELSWSPSLEQAWGAGH